MDLSETTTHRAKASNRTSLTQGPWQTLGTPGSICPVSSWGLCCWAVPEGLSHGSDSLPSLSPGNQTSKSLWPFGFPCQILLMLRPQFQCRNEWDFWKMMTLLQYWKHHQELQGQGRHGILANWSQTAPGQGVLYPLSSTRHSAFARLAFEMQATHRMTLPQLPHLQHVSEKHLGFKCWRLSMGVGEGGEGNYSLQTSSPIAVFSQGRDVSNRIYFEDPVCEIPPLTFKLQFHLHYMVPSRCQNFPNDKHSGKTWEHTGTQIL